MSELFLQAEGENFGWGWEIRFIRLDGPGDGEHTGFQLFGMDTYVHLYGVEGNPNHPLVSGILRHIAIFLPQMVQTSKPIPSYIYTDPNPSQSIEKRIAGTHHHSGIKVVFMQASYESRNGEPGLNFTHLQIPPVGSYKYFCIWIYGYLTKVHLYLPPDFPDEELQGVGQHIIASVVNMFEQS